MFVAAEKSSGADKPLTIAMMPKSKGNAYFISCRKGAEQAAKDLGVKLLWDGPTEPDPRAKTKSSKPGLHAAWMSSPSRLKRKKASRRRSAKPRKKASRSSPGMRMPEADARDFLINQATPEGIGSTLMDEAAKRSAIRGSSRSSPPL